MQIRDGVQVTGASTGVPVALTDGSSIAVNAAAGNDFRLTLGASGHKLANPTGLADGQRILVWVTQGTGGGFTLTYDTVYEFTTALPAPTLSAAAGVVDLLGFIYNATTGKLRFAAFLAGS